MADKQIYFCGSIRGGRGDQALYLELIRYLARLGTVLTEHIGSSDLSTVGEPGLTDREIYERDMVWLRASDVVVAEVTTPSLGVGYEIACAEQFHKPVLCLFRENSGRTLSAMVSGNRRIEIVRYQSLDDLRDRLGRWFDQYESI